MVKAIPLTHLSDYVAEAKAIQRRIGRRTPAGAEVRQAVADLAGLAVKALEDADQAIEGLAGLLMALHPEVTRNPPAGGGRAPRPAGRRRGAAGQARPHRAAGADGGSIPRAVDHGAAPR